MTEPRATFRQLQLAPPLLQALESVGYETPSPIQEQSIPPLLEGRDLLGQAQTGTGKTAAFALPMLQQIDVTQKSPQALVLAPTRELAIQVAEAFQRYATFMKGFHILPVYGGQGYSGQIRALKRGVHVVVGTPGRVMDHIRKGTLSLDNLKHLVLDEADEMLRMGFIDDVKWVLEHCPDEKQIALFSATMPKEIARVADTHLVDPVKIKIQVKTTTAATIQQRYWQVGGLHKLDALTRILEVEDFDAMIIFVRTKTSTVELSDKLQARGYSSAALNGDISQNLRERTVDQLKKGGIDILVATDVAARGLDVERISHVLNYDIPYDTEAYVHRIGRTGRAGREGQAILFVAKRELRMLRAIEKSTQQKIERMSVPSIAEINLARREKYKESVTELLENEDLTHLKTFIQEIQEDTRAAPLDIAAAFAYLSEGERGLFLEERPERPERRERKEREPRSKNESSERRAPSKRKKEKKSDVPMDTYRIEVGHDDQVTPQNIVGAIANEADIESQFIGHIKIQDDHSLVELPSGMPKQVFKTLKKAWVCQKQLNITLVGGEKKTQEKPHTKAKPKTKKGGTKGKPSKPRKR